MDKPIRPNLSDSKVSAAEKAGIRLILSLLLCASVIGLGILLELRDIRTTVSAYTAVTYDTPPPERFQIPDDRSVYRIRKNVAGQKIPIWLTGQQWGEAINGLLPGAISCRLSKDQAAFVTTTDTDESQEPPADGPYWLELSKDETNADILVFICQAVMSVPYRLHIATVQ